MGIPVLTTLIDAISFAFLAVPQSEANRWSHRDPCLEPAHERNGNVTPCFRNLRPAQTDLLQPCILIGDGHRT